MYHVEFQTDLELFAHTVELSSDQKKYIIKRGADVGVRFLRNRAPVRTGQLRARWRYGNVSTAGNTLRVSLINDAHETRRHGYTYYEWFVEKGYTRGNRFVRGRHDAEPTVDRVLGAVVQATRRMITGGD